REEEAAFCGQDNA
ncbi:hypothetical protein TrRE_jg11723, partial [Triparma retinervis]